MFYIAHISLVLIVVFLIVITRFRSKSPLRTQFIAFMVELFVWTFSVIAQQYCILAGQDQSAQIFERLTYFGVAFIPVQMILICMHITSSGIKSRRGFYLLFVIPVLTQVMVWTTDLHHAFYINYAFMDMGSTEFGWYFYIHTVYSYVCVLGAFFFLTRFAIRNRGSGGSNAQAYILLVGTTVPVITNICFTLGVAGFTLFSTPVAFLITVLAYFFGVYRYNMIKLSPIAMKTVMDKVTDLYIVLDENLVILDYNQPFYDVFSPLIALRRQVSLPKALGELNKAGVSADRIMSLVKECQESRKVIHSNLKLDVMGEERHYAAEFLAFIIDNEYYGCILLLRDITKAMHDMEEIKQNHLRLIEQEHLASLGQLMGGIAHNLKTPIMAMSGRLENIETLISEYEQSVGDKKVTEDDHREIAKEMRTEADNIRSHLAYISEIITTVKDQTVTYNEDSLDTFTIGELIRRTQILMENELIRNNNELIYKEEIDEETRIYGDINTFVQIIDNIIINAMQAYAGAHGKIWLTVSKAHEDVVISIRDEACGIPKDVQDKLFKQMITTKGIDGTGLGLYISYSTIVGRYGGKMWFKSDSGKGSEFFISIPHKRRREGRVRLNEDQ